MSMERLYAKTKPEVVRCMWFSGQIYFFEKRTVWYLGFTELF